MTTLRQAAQAAIERWDAPMGSDLPDIGNCMADLRKAFEEPEQEPDVIAQPVQPADDRAAFEVWARKEGLNIRKAEPKADGGIPSSRFGLCPATYYFDEAECAWRAWANKHVAQPVQPEPDIKALQADGKVLQAKCDAFLANVQLLEVEIEAMAKERDALRVAGKIALEALTEYANPYNWDEDFHGIRRKWREPSSSTPTSYNGFELAQKTLAVLQAAGVTA